MAELSFRLILQTDDATGKLAGVRQAADGLRQDVEKPAVVKISAEQSLATIRDVKIAFDGVLQIVSGATTAINGLLDDALSARQAMRLAGIAFGEGAAGMAQFAAELQRVTNFEGDQLLSLMAKLSQTYGMAETDIRALTPALLDWAEANKATGLSVESAFDLMGRAVNGHTEMLSRQGIVMDANRLAVEGVSYVIEVLAGKYDGTARALVDLRTQNRQAWGDIRESVGDMLEVIISPLLQGIKLLMDAYQSLTPISKGFVAGLVIAVPTVIAVAGAVTTLTVAVHALKTAINPVAGTIGIVVGALSAFGFTVAATQVATQDFGAAQETIGDKISRAQDEVAQEAASFSVLAGKLLEIRSKTDQTAESKAELGTVVQTLNDKYGSYLGNIDLERAAYDTLASSLRDVSEALIAKAIATKFGDEYQKQLSKVADLQVQVNRGQAENLALIQKRDNYLKAANAEFKYSDANAMGWNPSAEFGNDGEWTKMESRLNKFAALTGKLQAAKQDLDVIGAAYQQAYSVIPALAIQASGGSSGAGGSNALTAAQREAEQRRRDAERLIADLADLRLSETQKIEAEYQRRLTLIKEYTASESAAQIQAIQDLDAWKVAQENDARDRDRSALRAQFEAQISYYSNLENLGVSSYDSLKKTMEEYYAWAKTNLAASEADLILAQLRETNLRWSEHIAEKEREQRDLRDEFAKTDLDLAGDTYRAELLALDRYYADRHAKLIAAGLSETDIERQKQESIRKLNEQTGIQAMKSVSGTLGGFAAAANKESRRGFALWKALAMSQAMIDTLGGAIAAYRSVVGIPGIGPGLAVAAAAAATAAGFANIAKIEQTKFEPPRAARGGYLSGPSHARGGILIEAEGDEYITAKDRVQALGRSFFDFVNFGPLNQVRALVASLPGPSMSLPDPSWSYAGGGYVSSSASLADLASRLDTLIDAVLSSRPQITVEVDPLSSDPVKVSQIADRGKLIRSEF